MATRNIEQPRVRARTAGKPDHCAAALLLLTLVLIVISSLPLQAQSERYEESWRWIQFTTESGLPSGEVVAVCDAPDGITWAATSNGVAWYDGFRWIAIDSSRGLPPGKALTVMPAQYHGVFVVIGETLYRGDRDGFMQFGSPHGEAAECTANGAVFFASEKMLYVLQHDSLCSLPVTVQHEQPPTGLSRFLWQTPAHIWLTAPSGMYLWNGRTWHLAIPATSLMVASYLCEDRGGNGCVSFGKPVEVRGLWEWNNNSAMRHSREPMDIIQAMDIAPDGDVVAIDKYGEVHVRHAAVWHRLTQIPRQVRTGNFVRFRSDGNCWIATRHGLFLLDLRSTRWRVLKQNSPIKNRIHAIIRTKDRSLWIATADGLGIYRPDGRYESITQILGTTLNDVTGLAEDNNGYIWISSGSSFNGMFRWDGVRWTHFSADDRLTTQKFHRIFADREGRIWFVGLNTIGKPEVPTSGVAVYEHGRFQLWGTDEELFHGRVYGFAEGADGARWFGTSTGLCRWKDDRWTRWFHDRDRRPIFTLAFDKMNTLWVGTRGQGLARIDQNDSITYLTTADGLTNNGVWEISVDPIGRVWIATDDGLNCYRNGSLTRYDSRSGLPMQPLWPLLPVGDTVYIGTSGSGLVVLNLRDCNQPIPRIFLENPVTENGTVALLWHPLAFWGEPQPENILTRYRLEDGAWSNWSTIHRLSLQDLSPKAYHYQIQAQNSFGQFDSLGVVGSFSIAPPLFLRPMFVLPIGGSILIVVIVSVQYITRRRRHTAAVAAYQQQLRSLATELSLTENRERRQMAIFLHDYIGQTLALCKIKLESLQHPASPTDIEDVCRHLEQVIEHTQSLTFELSPPVLHELGLKDAIEWLAERMHAEHHVQFTIHDDNQPKPLSEEFKTFLFNAVRELFVNAIKHGHATTIAIDIERIDGQIRITVDDNGVGFQPRNDTRKTEVRSGFGLFNIEERIMYLGGSVRIESGPNKGTRIVLEAPLDLPTDAPGKEPR